MVQPCWKEGALHGGVERVVPRLHLGLRPVCGVQLRPDLREVGVVLPHVLGRSREEACRFGNPLLAILAGLGACHVGQRAMTSSITLLH
eukprot:12904193-Prorocentrum_lima.AAC.1